MHVQLTNDGLVTVPRDPQSSVICSMLLKTKLIPTNVLVSGSINPKGMNSSRMRQLIELLVLS